MKHFRKYRIHLLVFIMILISIPISATNGQDGDALFTPPNQDPVIQLESTDPLYSRFGNPGAVIFHNDQFHMFTNGFRSWPASTKVGYFTSPDGLEWTAESELPVFGKDDVDYASVTIMVSSVLVEDDGTWVLYFYTWDSFRAPIGRGTIARATASEPTGPWTPDEAPILVAGSEGTWDAQQVGVPYVIQSEDNYLMYYSGFAEDETMRIGLAISDDGIHWEKYDDPETTDALFTESDPILEPGADGEWDEHGVERPRVLQTPDGWIMLYRSPGGNGEPIQMGLATSEDGIHWEKYNDGPTIIPSDFPDGQSTFLFSFLYENNTYYVYCEAITSTRSGSNIYLITHEGSLFNEE